MRRPRNWPAPPPGAIIARSASCSRRIEPDVLRHCERLLPYRQDAEEAAQDTLLAVARNIARFEGRAKFSTWLHIVTANCARTTYRILKRRASEQAGGAARAAARTRAG